MTNDWEVLERDPLRWIGQKLFRSKKLPPGGGTCGSVFKYCVSATGAGASDHFVFSRVEDHPPDWIHPWSTRSSPRDDGTARDGRNPHPAGGILWRVVRKRLFFRKLLAQGN